MGPLGGGRGEGSEGMKRLALLTLVLAARTVTRWVSEYPPRARPGVVTYPAE